MMIQILTFTKDIININTNTDFDLFKTSNFKVKKGFCFKITDLDLASLQRKLN